MKSAGARAQGLQVSVVKAVRCPVAPPFVRAALTAAAALPEVAARLPAEAELTLRITGDRELRRLNARFLGDDRPTDVLSFAAGEPGAYLGDLAISWPAAVRQAGEHGHPATSELALLAVHGLLHLLGWDHAAPLEEREMIRLTQAGLAEAGVEIAAGRI